MGQGFTIRQLIQETEECECCSCGKRKACEWRKNPFVAEVWPEDENPEQWWCEDCWQERKDDI